MTREKAIERADRLTFNNCDDGFSYDIERRGGGYSVVEFSDGRRVRVLPDPVGKAKPPSA